MWSNLGHRLILQRGVLQPVPPRREGPSPVRELRPCAKSRGQAGIYYRANRALFRHTTTRWARWARLLSCLPSVDSKAGPRSVVRRSGGSSSACGQDSPVRRRRLMVGPGAVSLVLRPPELAQPESSDKLPDRDVFSVVLGGRTCSHVQRVRVLSSEGIFVCG